MGIRVLGPAPRGIFWLNAAAGIVTSMGFMAASFVLEPVLRFGAAATVGAIGLAWVLLMASAIPGLGRLCGCVSVYAVALGASSSAFMSTHPLHMQPAAVGGLFGLSLLRSLGSVAFAVAGVLGMRGVMRLAAGRVVRQDGSVCWRCGYSRNGLAGEVCPECGTRWGLSHAPGLASWRIPMVRTLAARARVWFLVLACVVVVIFWSRLEARRANRDFVASMTSQGLGIGQGVMSLDATRSSIGRQVPYAYTQYRVNPAHYFAIAYDASPRDPGRAMLVRAMVWAPAKPDPFPSGVYAVLTREQARVVIERGLPAELLEALSAEVRGADELPLKEHRRVDVARFFAER